MRRLYRLSLTASLFALALAARASAQDIEPADGEATGGDIVVTGSRIARPDFSSPSPIQSFGAGAIERSGEISVTDFLADVPALLGSTTNERNAGSTAYFQSVGINLLNLRNLGTARTLVLVDGRRHVAGYPGVSSVDINTIPLDLIERVDVLTGGASAIYGADGVSGVVNFVMKRDFEGLRVRGQSGISEEGDAGQRFASIVAGRNFADDRANIAISYEYRQSDRLNDRDRAYAGDRLRRFELLQDPDEFGALDDPNVPDQRLFNDIRWQDSSPGGAVDTGFDFAPDFTGSGLPYDRGMLLPGSGGRTVGGSGTPTAGYYGDFLPYLALHNVNALMSYEMDPALRLYAEGKYAASTAFTAVQPTFDFFTFLAADNPFIPDTIRDAIVPGAAAATFGTPGSPDGILVTRDHLDFGFRASRSERETLRGVIGIDGSLANNLKYDLSYVHGRSEATTTRYNDRIADRYRAAIDAVIDPATGAPTCRINIDSSRPAPVTFAPGECVPLNILGVGAPSQAALDFVSLDHKTRAAFTQQVISGAIWGDLGSRLRLPAGPIGFALGAEYRRETSRSTPSDLLQQGQLLDYVEVEPSHGEYDVKEAFGEVNIPLLANVPYAPMLSVGGALRLSDYSTIGGATTWSVNGVYAPVPDISFRGTLSQAVRAPNIAELFDPLSGTFDFVTDPCDPSNINSGATTRPDNCQALLQNLGLTSGDIAAFSPATDPEANTSRLGVSGGNPDLKEETARTWTAGLVLRPRAIPGLSAAIDWYDIRLRDAINEATASELAALCVDQANVDNIFCDAVTRDPATGFVTGFVARPQNVASFDTSGLDVTLSYRFEPRNLGRFNLRLVGGYLHKLRFIPAAGAEPDLDRGERYAPKYSGTADLTWTSGPLLLNYGLSWADKTRRFTTEELLGNPDISDPRFLFYKERWEHDIHAAYDVEDRFTLYGGVNNLTDEKPSVSSGGSYPVSPVGRFFYIGARMTLDDLLPG